MVGRTPSFQEISSMSTGDNNNNNAVEEQEIGLKKQKGEIESLHFVKENGFEVVADPDTQKLVLKFICGQTLPFSSLNYGESRRCGNSLEKLCPRTGRRRSMLSSFALMLATMLSRWNSPINWSLRMPNTWRNRKWIARRWCIQAYCIPRLNLIHMSKRNKDNVSIVSDNVWPKRSTFSLMMNFHVDGKVSTRNCISHLRKINLKLILSLREKNLMLINRLKSLPQGKLYVPADKIEVYICYAKFSLKSVSTRSPYSLWQIQFHCVKISNEL